MIVHPGPAHDGPPSAASKAAVERFNDAKKLFSTPDLSPVRVATEADRGAVERLARLMHAEVGMFRLNPRKLHDTIELGLKHRLIGVVGLVGAPVGVLCLAIESLHYTDDFHLSDKFFFVHPDHRRTAHARSLIDWARRTQRAIGIPLFISVFNTTRTEAKARLMDRQLAYCGSTFAHGLPESITPDLEEAS